MTIRKTTREPGFGAEPRSKVVAKLARRFLAVGFPRVTVLIILVLSGGAAFLISVAALAIGVESMGIRYLVAALAGYLVFVGFIRLWIAWQRRRIDLDCPDLPGVESAVDFGGRGPVKGSTDLFGGGRSGGGGASGSWSEGSTSALSSAGDATAGLADAADDAWWLVAAAALALGGLLAIGFVVYVAPVLLAEVALDAALVSVAYRRLRREDVGHWAGAVWRHTRLPACVLTVLVSLAGFAFQQAVPEARSIGDVIAAIRR